MNRTAFLCVASLLLASVPAGPVPDGVFLKDGRVVEGKPIKKTEKGIKILFQNGEVVVPDEMIKDFYGSSSDVAYKPRNEEEAKKIEHGLIPVGGKWIPRKDLGKEIERRNQQSRKRIEEAKLHKLWRNRYTSESRHFKFEHNLPPEIFANLRDLLEVYFDTFTKKWGLSPTLKVKPLVCLYADELDYYRTSGAPHGAIGYFAFGKTDTYTILDVPSNADMAAIGATIGASGAVEIETIVLLTPAEIDQASKKTVSYRPPGA